MAVFKCKMCGGTLEINNNETVAVCEYCGTKQTLPKLDDEKRVQLYDRANHFRRENEFDKAMGIYEMILSDDKEDCESYWGIVLCRYGIEYVEDPRTHKRIPTVNRAQFTSIFDDDDYKNAIKYADGYQKDVYEAEASVIDKIQKGILEISNKEEPFDVFICYKETDSHGNRTQDSVYAQDIYAALTKEGYKVFFSRITLEDKLGSAYEPYIFAALNSAKVMLVVGTEKQNFNAVWVKNEWSRYISLIKAGKDKTLIPVYKDISPYDMPEEFQYLQSQDMSKIGFMQDLVRGISKLVETNKTTVKETVVVNNSNNTAPLLERAFMFLEDGDWNSADEYCEKVLDLDPKNAQAYLGKLMSELRVRRQEELVNCEQPFDKLNNYQKAIRFADGNLRITLEDYIRIIVERNEIQIRTNIYNQAIDMMNSANTEDEFASSAELFGSIIEFNDSKELKEKCLNKLEELKQERIVREEAEQLARKREADEIKIKKEKALKKKKRNRKMFLIAFLLVCGLSALISVLVPKIEMEKAYDTAIELYEQEEYVLSGQALFEYRNSSYSASKKEKIEEMKQTYYTEAEKYFDSADYYNAAILFGCAGDYGDAWDRCISTWRNVRQNQKIIAAAATHSLGLNQKGNVISTKYLGPNFEGQTDEGQTNVNSWKDIIAINASNYCSFGLKQDGTVVSTGSYAENTNDWKNIVEINTFDNGVAGLTKEGTVFVSGSTCKGVDVSNWDNMIYAVPATDCVIGVDYNGKVHFSSGDEYCTRYGSCDKLNDIVMITADYWNVYAIRADGMTIKITNELDVITNGLDIRIFTKVTELGYGVATLSSYGYATAALYQDGHTELLSNGMRLEKLDLPKDLIAIDVGDGYAIGLKQDGTVVSCGENKSGATDVQNWNLF